MLPHQERFARLLVRYEVVRFGDFTLKSGRKSPYFVNAGQLRTGEAIAGIGEAFAQTIAGADLPHDLIFGPAYKGIPLAVATVCAFAGMGEDVPYGFDRKEAKDHGEGGSFVATQPADGQRVILVDDVITSGKSLREAAEQLRAAAKVTIAGAVVAVDRQERGRGEKTTLAELRDDLDISVHAVLTIRELVDWLHGRELDGRVVVDDERRAAIESHLAEYGGTD
jgi:orotate phosphoribosyltransferase